MLIKKNVIMKILENLGTVLTKEEQKTLVGGDPLELAGCQQRSQLSYGGTSIVFYDCMCDDADGQCTGMSVNGGPIVWDGIRSI